MSRGGGGARHSTTEEERGLSNLTYFSKYMKSWRFKDLKLYIPHAMEDDIRKDADDWWKLSTCVGSFNKKIKETIFVSHILVFDK